MNTIAVVFGERGGSSYHRQFTPHTHFSRNYTKDFKVLFFEKFEQITEADFKEIQLIQFARFYNSENAALLKEKGIIIVLDQDDYWYPEKDDIAYHRYKYMGLAKKMETCMELANHITCTTSTLADKVRQHTDKYSDDITVIPNSIDQDIPQFRPGLSKTEDYTKIGWLGSPSHINDISMIAESFRRLHKSKELWRKWQLLLGGFDMSIENLTEMQIMKDGSLKPHSIKPYESIYGLMERIFTDEYKVFKGKEFDEYLTALGRFTEQLFQTNTLMPYRRFWSKQVTEYMSIYNEMDVVIIPVRGTPFDICKSELKMIESGFFGKAVIVSGVKPYTNDARNEENCLTVKNGQAHVGFFTAMRKLILDPDLRKRLANNLRKDMIEKYNMNRINKIRYELYTELIRKKNAN